MNFRWHFTGKAWEIAMPVQQYAQPPQIWHNDAERVSEVHGCKKNQFQKTKMADSRHLENRKIAISHDDAERVSLDYLPFAIFIFYS